MSWGDVRGLLQYVPQFRGKVFVILVDAPVTALAETMLDLLSLQNIGVQLVIGSTVHSTDDLLDRAAEVELKYSQAVYSGGDSSVEAIGEALAALQRGQAVVADFHGSDAFSPSVAQFAVAIDARKLVLLHPADSMPAQGAIRAAGVNDSESPLILAAAKICDSGVPRVHILDGSLPAVLLDELFSNEGVGTMVYADSYRVVRPLREDDIVELLGMISRSVRNSTLVPRGYSDILANISDYSVMDIDGNVVGSVALHHYEGADMAEVACLYVKQAHEGLGYGIELVRHAEQQAQQAGAASVFALTNRAAKFFQQLDYRELPADQIPANRHEQLLASGRDSRVFAKVVSTP
ncbi:GNAT family N-acetyltransferase [Verrucomicrobiaceae bacterium 5K15]|uniref:GNAT family N-acetyltransferase n=1 Tax=Oceaniferula flava TaxID=2800421 RepID=A0AAE2SDX6_9BACT|nr:GNAT family N-acetyltransferase [Oceaniferula flavus]MBK1856118.1 GNAT family N-acetyltransferase [Oceaniferula flavus]MBM1137425.1 GNAT family N-acetyltransferase [Oceaniferula flavus]